MQVGLSSGPAGIGVSPWCGEVHSAAAVERSRGHSARGRRKEGGRRALTGGAVVSAGARATRLRGSWAGSVGAGRAGPCARVSWAGTGVGESWTAALASAGWPAALALSRRGSRAGGGSGPPGLGCCNGLREKMEKGEVGWVPFSFLFPYILF